MLDVFHVPAGPPGQPDDDHLYVLLCAGLLDAKTVCQEDNTTDYSATGKHHDIQDVL